MRRRSIAILCLLLLAACKGPASDEVERDAVINDDEIRFMHDGVTRRALLHIPSDISADATVPLVIALHGGGGNAEQARDTFGFDVVADREGFIVAYPQGTGPTIARKTVGTWNAEACCGQAAEKNIDDVGFIVALIDHLTEELPVDPRRVYVTGHSNGALLAYRLACDAADRIAAIAPVGGFGALQSECIPARAIPILHIHGNQDACMPFEGGTCGGCFADLLDAMNLPSGEGEAWQCRALSDELEEWRAAYECSPELTTEYKQGAVRMTVSGCNDGAEISLLKIDELGHVWPGGGEFSACVRAPQGKLCKEWSKIVGPTNDEFSASEEIWKFFEKH